MFWNYHNFHWLICERRVGFSTVQTIFPPVNDYIVCILLKTHSLKSHCVLDLSFQRVYVKTVLSRTVGNPYPPENKFNSLLITWNDVFWYLIGETWCDGAYTVI